MYKDRQISIGIYLPAFAATGDLSHTLDTIALSRIPGRIKIGVFADGIKMDTGELPAQVSLIYNEEPKGKAYCFNRLASQMPADYFVWAEAGLLLAPNCLDLLVKTLEEQPGDGLAGPSTNIGWNQQASLLPPSCNTNYREIAGYLEKRYGGMHATLEPLYSLSDFCYVVRKEVIDAIGGADEAYGMAPCWEMDLNIRAARAGFRGWWVKDAFAWRTLSWPPEDLAKGRELYQSRFCSLQLSSAGSPFRDHCRGDRCPNFAVSQPAILHPAILQPAVLEPIRLQSYPPMVSCIMPTANRPQFIKKAIQYFTEQDYPCKELIIVYNDPGDLPSDLPPDPQTASPIKFVQSPAKSIGAKRNEGCRQANGPIIAQWDDDDIYHTERLSRQVQPILEGAAEMTGLHSILFYEPAPDKCWACSPELFRRLFAENVAAGTLVYLKSYWTQTGYPEISLREDAEFMGQALRKEARLQKLDGKDLFIYLRHGTNTWKFRTGAFLQQAGWSEVALPAWAGSSQSRKDQPLVSCIMPTADRQDFLPAAIRYFLQQDYPHTELIIVDDGQMPAGPLVPDDPRIRYTRLPAKGTPVGHKRNYACQMAKGDIILHWDDDDWYAPGWISCQVKSLQTSGADITGLARVLFYAPYTQNAWKYIYPETERPWVAGATMAYKRSLWLQYPFRNMRIGEDNDFVWQSGGKVFAHSYEKGFVSIIHPSNTSPKNTRDPRWRNYPVQQILDILPEDRTAKFNLYEPHR